MKAPSPRLFAGRKFTPIFITQFGGAFNDNVLKYTLITLATFNPAYTEGLQKLLKMDGAQVSQQLNLVASALFILPFLVFSAVAGTMADKYPKHTFIRYVKLAEIAIMFVMVAGLMHENIYLLLLALFFMGVHSAFFGPLKYGILPELLPREAIPSATGFMQGATFVAILAGTAAGGLLTKGANATLWNSVMILSVALIGYLAARCIPELKAAAPRTENAWSPLGEFKETLGYAFKHRQLALGVVGLSWFWGLGSVILALLPPFTKLQLGADQSVATGLIICAAVCVATGAVLCGQLVKDTSKVGLAGMAVGAFLAALALLPAVPQQGATLHTLLTLPLMGWAYFGVLVLFSLSCGFFTVPLFAMLQIQADPKHKARTIAANNIMNAVFMVAGTMCTSIFIGVFALSPYQVFLGFGGLTVLLGLFLKKNLKD